MVASAALAGAGFAAFKVFQSRRSGGPAMPSGDESIMPKRSETPLVKPSLMDGLDLRRTNADADDSGNGQLLTDAPPTATPVDVPAPAPAPKAPTPKAAPTGDAGWVDPEAGGACPDGYPVKAKLASGIFHAPGMLAYDRTTPDRCYRDEAAAEADGLRKAKR
jgi:hypothetical protein